MQNISIKNIYWMIAYAFRNLNILDKEMVSSENFENIYDLFAYIMSKELYKLIKRGLNREYIVTDEELSTIKGKIKFNNTIKENLLIKNKLICEIDEYSPNMYLNQIIKTACKYLINSKKITTDDRKKRLNSLMQYLNNIDTLDTRTIRWSTINYNKNNSSYRLLINISYLIIEGLLITKKNGEIEFKNFIDDQKMHKLYEKFILEYYRYHYSNLKPKSSQIKWNINNKENTSLIDLLPKMQTDITLYYKDKILIIDAKYYSNMYQNNQLFNKETFKSYNLYQIFTYVKNEDKDNVGNVSGMLLYVKTNYNDAQWAEYDMNGNKIIVSNLDLSDDFDKVKKHLNMIADKFISNEF